MTCVVLHLQFEKITLVVYYICNLRKSCVVFIGVIYDVTIMIFGVHVKFLENAYHLLTLIPQYLL